jgi:hypothetical protein
MHHIVGEQLKSWLGMVYLSFSCLHCMGTITNFESIFVVGWFTVHLAL